MGQELAAQCAAEAVTDGAKCPRAYQQLFSPVTIVACSLPVRLIDIFCVMLATESCYESPVLRITWCTTERYRGNWRWSPDVSRHFL